MKKKSRFIPAIVMISLSGFTLIGCSNVQKNRDIISMKEGNIGINDLYKKSKELQQIPTSTILQDLIFSKILEQEFGSKISEKTVQKQANAIKKQMGNQFSSAIQEHMYTENGFNFLTRLQLLTTYAVEQEISKTQYTDTNLKAEWKNYHPEVEAVIVHESTKEEAVKESKSDANIFEKKNIKDKIKFDSNNTSIPIELKTATFKLKQGQLSKPIEIQDVSSGRVDYYVIKMIKNSVKGMDMNKYKEQLKIAIKNEKETDIDYINKVKAGYIKSHHVVVKEKQLSYLLPQFSSESLK